MSLGSDPFSLRISPLKLLVDIATNCRQSASLISGRAGIRVNGLEIGHCLRILGDRLCNTGQWNDDQTLAELTYYWQYCYPHSRAR